MEPKVKNVKDIEEIIAKAVKKIGGKQENELCKYLPMKVGGYMHHFTFRKMRAVQAQELAVLVDKFVLQVDKPVIVAPKQRAPRGSRKRKDHLNFSKSLLDRMLSVARMAGDRELVTILSPRRSLAACRRELMQSIRQNRAEQELWTSYADAVQAHQMVHGGDVPAATPALVKG